MLAELKSRVVDLERAAKAAEGRDDDLIGMVAALSRTVGVICRVLEEDRPGTAGRLLAGLDVLVDQPVEGSRERATERMRATIGCVQEFLIGIGKLTHPRIADNKW